MITFFNSVLGSMYNLFMSIALPTVQSKAIKAVVSTSIYSGGM